jgi:hypothetical protein
MRLMECVLYILGLKQLNIKKNLLCKVAKNLYGIHVQAKTLKGKSSDQRDAYNSKIYLLY